VSKPELGVKRICANCGGKFYDLHNDPIVCLSEMRERVHPGSTRPDVAALGGAPMARGRREGGNAGAALRRAPLATPVASMPGRPGS